MRLKLLLAAASALLLNITIAQKVSIKGKLHITDTTETLKLINMYTGLDITIPVNDDKSFESIINIPEKGIYVLSPISEVYLAPGAKIEMLPDDQTGYQFSGSFATENNIIMSLKDQEKMLPLGGELGIYFSAVNQSPSIFIEQLNKYETAVNKKIVTSSDPFFTKTYKTNKKNEAQLVLRKYKEYYGLDSAIFKKVMNPTKAAYYTSPNDQYKLLSYQVYALKAEVLTPSESWQIDSAAKVSDWNDEFSYKNSYSYRENIMSSLKDIVLRKQTETTKLMPDQEALRILAIVDDLIDNETMNHEVKGVNGIAYLRSAKDGLHTDSIYQLMANLELSDHLRKQANDLQNSNQLLKADPQSLDFAYTTVDEEVVTLKSMRGKYVYIDLWATWCAPCKAEIPHLRKLEEKYKGKNIQFVSISLDKQADKKTWASYVREQKLPGVQIMADKDFRSTFVQAFQVASIPRFLLIAPDGQIVSADALRPSNAALQNQLDTLLN
ncbi:MULTISPECIES: TlpA family protein disulfide reductase [Sphingobacterium]|uniref:TlpA family protein disulfide reductase n=1 Tax=Sphingobacterium populi TaxID=1812824 RepID=A0ABW5UEL6_9SPHI|nr:TlpA disulfide reductase family protein [Sphingobacterium sp. CFCC 11742]